MADSDKPYFDWGSAPTTRSSGRRSALPVQEDSPYFDWGPVERTLPQKLIEDPITAAGNVFADKLAPEDVDAAGRQAYEQEQAASGQRIEARRAELGSDSQNLLMRGWSDLASGAAGTVGSSAEYIGRQAGWQWLEKFGQEAQEEAAALKPTNATLADDVLAGFGSVITFAAPGTWAAASTLKAAQLLLAAGKIGPAGVATAIKAAPWVASGLSTALESAGVAQEAFDQGMAEHGNQSLAEKRALIAGLRSAPVVFFTDKLGVFGDNAKALKALGITFATEAAQEGTQRILTNVAGYQPAGEGVAYDALIGGLAGGGVKSIQIAAEKWAQRNAEPDTGGKDVTIDLTRPLPPEEMIKAAEVNPNIRAALSAKMQNLGPQEGEAFVAKLIAEGHTGLAQSLLREMQTETVAATAAQIEQEIPQFVRRVDEAVEAYLAAQPQQPAAVVPADPTVTPPQGSPGEPVPAAPLPNSPDAAIDQQLTTATQQAFPEAGAVAAVPEQVEQPQTGAITPEAGTPALPPGGLVAGQQLAAAPAATPSVPTETAVEPVTPALPSGGLQATGPVPMRSQEELYTALVQDLNKVAGGAIDESSIRLAAPDATLQRLARAVKRAFGTDILWVEADELRLRSGKVYQPQAFLGKSIAGQNAIAVNLKRGDQQASIRNTIGHELTHQLEERYPRIYKVLQAAAKQRIATGKAKSYQGWLSEQLTKENEAAQRTMAPAEFQAQLDAEYQGEITAEVVGEMWDDAGFWSTAFQMAPSSSFVREMVSTIKGLLNRLQRAFLSEGWTRGAKDIEAMRKAVSTAFAQWEQQEAAAQQAETVKAKTVGPAVSTKALVEAKTGVAKAKPYVPKGATKEAVTPQKAAVEPVSEAQLAREKQARTVHEVIKRAVPASKTPVKEVIERATGVKRKKTPPPAGFARAQARKGGEEGINKEQYKGGQFLPGSPETKKGEHVFPKGLRKGTRQMIEPGNVWGERPADGARAILSQGEFTMRGPDGYFTTGKLTPLAAYVEYQRDPELLARIQKLADAYNEGYRWLLPDGSFAKKTPKPVGAFQRAVTEEGHTVVGTTGKLVGSPPWVTTPKQLTKLRKKLKEYLEVGKAARFWYERSSKAILDMFNGDTVAAEKFVGLLAIYSQDARVSGNTTMALNAYYQWLTGQPISHVHYGSQDRKAQAWMDRGEDWGGIKTNNFYINLMAEIDPSKIDEHATMDVWMKRAFGYDSVGSGFPETQYGFMHRETNLLAREMGWKPHQAQAAIWTGIKSITEKTEPETAGYSFAEALNDRLAQLSWEAQPGETVDVLPGVQTAPIEQKLEYFEAVRNRLYAPDGTDLIAQKIGLPHGIQLTGFSAWKGNVGVGGQAFFPVRIEGQKNKRQVGAASRQLLDLYSALKGYILSQEAVVWHHPIYDPALKSANGYELTYQRALTAAEMKRLYAAIHAKFGTWELAPGYTASGVRVLNFTDISNKDFQSGMEEVLSSLPKGFGGTLVAREGYRSDGNYISNDWETFPNGQQYLEKIQATAVQNGGGELANLQEWADGLRSGVEAVNQHFSNKYGWGEWRQPQSRTAGYFQRQADASAQTVEAPRVADAQQQLQYLAVEARKAGYKNVDEFANADYLTFMQKAEEWRRKHPLPAGFQRPAEAAIVNPIDPTLPPKEKVKALQALSRENEPIVRRFIDTIDAKYGTESKLNHKDPNKIESKAVRPSILARKPWFQIEHIRDSFRFKTVLDDLTKLPDIVAEAEKTGIEIVKRDVDKVLAPAEWGWRIAVFDLRMPNGQLVEWYLPTQELEEAKNAGGHQHFDNWRNFDPDTMPVEARNRMIESQFYSRNLYGAAWAAYLERTGQSPSAIRASLNRVAASSSETATKSSMYSSAENTLSAIQTPSTLAAKNPVSEVIDTRPSASLETRTVDSIVAPPFDQSIPKGSFQRVDTSTPEFKRWFGDSKVVDANGKPLVVYHGTAIPKTAFRREGGAAGVGAYFTSSKKVARDYAKMDAAVDGEKPIVMAVYLSLQNPLVTDDHMDFQAISEERRDELEAQGYDGVIGRYPDGSREFVAFRSEQIKSAIGNRGTFDPNDPRIGFQRPLPIAGQKFTLPAETPLDKTQRLLQDRENRLKRIQEAVAAQGGTVDMATDTYLAAERYPKVTAYKLERFREKTVEPLLARIGKSGVEMSDIALYLYATFAPQRNAQIAAINPAMPDGGSGMTNAEAANILATFAQDPQLPQIQAFAAEIKAITKRTQQILLDAGLVPPSVVAAWNTQSPDYVPLKGFEKIDELGDRSPGTGVGFDVRGPEARRALGRSSRAGQIIENVLFDHQRALVRAEKNKVGKVLLNFILRNPDSDLWQVNKIESMAQFYKKGGINASGLLNGEVRYQNKVVSNPDETIVVKHYGKEYAIWIKDPGLLRALKGKGGLMETGSQEVIAIERLWNSANRFLAKMWTALNPVFTTINFTRDFLTGMIHAANIGGVRYASKVAADIPAMMKGIWDVERNGNEQSPQAQWYMQYQQDGGKTGFYMFGDMDERLREIQRLVEVARQQTGVKGAFNAGVKAIQKIEDVIMDYNAIIENAIRVASYKAHVEANGGANATAEVRAEAASIAANLTVNFNRRGEWTPRLASLFLFFNPAVQGTTRILQAAKNNPKEFAAVTGSMVALGILMGMLAAEDKDDEGVPYWDRIPDYEKQRSLIIMTGNGDRVTIPLPYGYGFFINLGYGMSDLMRGRPVESVALGQATSAAQHFNPLGSTEEPVMMFVPTLLDPFVELYGNKRATGQPLMPDEQSLTGMPVPDSERYWGATRGTMAQEVTTWLNEATGGTKVTPGAIDVSPETVKNFIRYYGGGLGTFIADSAESIYVGNTVSGQAAAEKNIVPFLRQWYKWDGVKDDVSYYNEAKQKALTALEEAKKYYNTDRPGVLERIGRNQGLASLGASIRSMDTAMRSLRLQEISIMENKDLTAEERYEQRREIEARKEQLLEQWNAKFYEAEAESRR